MRHIQKTSEPQFLRKWKQNFVKINGRQPLYDDLRGTDIYLRLKESLIQEQGYLCCYCEKYIGTNVYYTDCDIEHFMPRHPDKRYLTSTEISTCENAQLDYTNMMASCKGEWQDSLDHCNHKKDNWFNFKTCISPTDEKIKAVFGYSTEGKVFPINGNQFGSDMQKH
ncbi:MAG: TIGR02646 family protein, partial [Lachnospiraceae bacterium]|nr:TIGR02646 family protein [Lachnospiraceae bacterium]